MAAATTLYAIYKLFLSLVKMTTSFFFFFSALRLIRGSLGENKNNNSFCPDPERVNGEGAERLRVECWYLADVLEVLDVVSLCAHDLIDDVGSHLVPVLEG